MSILSNFDLITWSWDVRDCYWWRVPRFYLSLRLENVPNEAVYEGSAELHIDSELCCDANPNSFTQISKT